MDIFCFMGGLKRRALLKTKLKQKNIAMQKKKKMNFVSFLLVFFTSIVVFSQQIKEGTYCVESGQLKLYYTCYTFYKNGTFNFKSGKGAEEYSRGKGTYQIKGSELIVEFKKSKPKKKGYSKIQFWRQGGDSISVEVEVKDLDNSLVSEGSLIKFSDSSSVKLDEVGKGVLKIKRANAKSIIKVVSEGYAEQEFNIKNYYNYKVDVFLSKQSGVPIFKWNITYKLDHITDSYYVTIGSNGNKILWEKRY